MNRKKPTVLLAESGEGSTGRVEELLEDRDIEVLKCVDGIEAIRTSFREKPDLIISDVTLPRLNGYQLARILKSDPLMNSTPIVLIGSLENPIERYWSRVCGGYDYLPKPVRQIDLDESLHKFLRIGGSKRQMMTSVSTIPDLEDYAILSLATNLLEHELLRATILNEINMIDISAMSAEDLVMALMTIVNCLHDFDLGAVLLMIVLEGSSSTRTDRLNRAIWTRLKSLSTNIWSGGMRFTWTPAT